MLAARFDNVWFRWGGRLVLWGILLGLGWWAFDRYWPTDDRDLQADQLVVDSSLLTLSDVPAGFERPITSTLSPLARADVEDAGSETTACAELDHQTSDLAAEPQAGRGFANSAGAAISSAQVIAGDSQAIEAYLEALREDTTGDCYAELWLQRLQEADPDAELVATSVVPMSTPAYGDDAVWWRLVGDLSTPGSSEPVFLDVIVVQVDRVGAQFSFQGIESAIGVQVHRSVMSPVLDRVREAVLPDDDNGGGATSAAG